MIGAIAEQVDASIAPLLDAAAPDVGLRDAMNARPRADAAERPDASLYPDAGGTLMVRIRAFGREDLSQLAAGCGSPCIDVEAIIEGGLPPYAVQWWDGETSARRKLCPAPRPDRAPPFDMLIDVVDAEGVIALHPPTFVSTQLECEADAPPQPWTLCLQSLVPGAPNCPGTQPPGVWFPLHPPLQSTSGGMSIGWTGAFVLPTRMVVAYRASACAEPVVLSDRTLGLLDPSYSLELPPSVDSVLVQFPDEAGGVPPFGVSVNLGGTCFSP
jgi:hypothetical protein